MIIRQNIAALTVNNQREINNKKMQKSLEKLSSGSRINRSADNAAGLAISEKFRQQIRGLRQAGNNAEDGIKFINVADGAMNEVTAIVHRMKELSVASLNDTYSERDRSLMEMEFNELQSEIDHTFKSSEYNAMNVFEQHESTYFSIKGNRAWDYTQEHKITSVNNNFMISIPSEVEGEADKDYEITVPLGIYTTEELVDEIETAFGNLRPLMPGFMFEYTQEGLCNFNYEGGEMVKSVSGGLSYLIYDNYTGGKFGNLLGTTEFTADFPLIVSSQNNQLKFYLGSGKNEEKVEITIPQNKYTREQMIDYLNDALKKKGITDVTAKEYKDQCIEIGGARIVTGLKGNMFELDEGEGGLKYTSVFYDNVKHGKVETTQGSFNGRAYFTRNTLDPYYGINIDSSNNSLKMRVDGKDPYVEISLLEKKYTVAEMIAELNKQFKEKGIDVTAKQESYYENYRYLDSITISSNFSGKESKIEIDPGSSCYATLFKETKYRDEKTAPITAGYYRNDPPRLTGTKNIPTPIEIKTGKNTLNLSVASSTYPLELSAGEYSSLEDLVTEINNQIDQESNIEDKIIAKKSGGLIFFTTKTPGGDLINSISFANPNQGTAYEDLFTSTTETVNYFYRSNSGNGSLPPKIEFPFKMVNPNEIKTGVNDTFTMQINGKEVSITLDLGNWTPDQLAEMMTKKLEEKYIPSYIFEGKGEEEYKEGQTKPTKYEPAKATNKYDLTDDSKIDSSNNTFKLNVNGKNEEITLSNGTYTRTTLVNEINKQFKKEGSGVIASLTGNKLTFTTEQRGKSASIKIDSLNCGSAGKIIAGISGVTASIKEGKLVLTGKDAASNERLYVYSGNAGSSIALFVGTTQVLSPARSTTRYEIKGQAYIDGASLTAPISIDSENNKLEFKYTKNKEIYNFSFELEKNDYTHEKLQNTLQEKINKVLTDASGIKDDPFVTVDASGITIKAKNPGDQYKLSNFEGNFHKFIISGTKDIEYESTPSSLDGTQKMTRSYTVGRKDVNNNPVKIETGKNDTLILEFTRPTPPGKPEVIELEIVLDAGTYQGDSLVAEIQKHLKETLKNNGLNEDIIKVGIGGISTGVVGANDNNAINFELSKEIDLSAGKYTIDGVRGSAAFYMFYLTEGEPIPAYTTGTANLGDEITIPADRNEFSFVVDGKKYDYTFPEKTYKSQEFIDMFNDLIEKGDNAGQFPPVKVELKEGHLNIFADDIGKHTIEKIDGTAKGLIFFTEEGRINEDFSFKLQVGANEGDTLDIGKITINTAFMKINTSLISKPKYAEKALNRLDYALDYLNTNRDDYGAKSNRLERIVKGNANTAENLQAAESRLRDTDMAKEVMENIKLTILDQSTQTIFAQAQKIPKGVLMLLS